MSSPARAFGRVGGDPIFASRGEGAWLYDSSGRRYVDFIQGFGAVILGHADPRVTDAVQQAASGGGAVGLSTPDEVRLAELIVEAVPSIEKVRFLTTGTEASMTAARIARAATGRDTIVTFEGCYHGHSDSFLAKAGSGVATFAVPAAAGVPQRSVEATIVVPYNDVTVLQKVFADFGHEIAAVFVEPVAANMGVVLPDAEFLVELTALASEAGALTVFDEVVTGFRLGRSGAQGLFDMTPDLTMLGKVVGGGLPVGVVGGRAELMDLLAPEGPVYQAGTFAAHPHAMAAGAAVLQALDDGAFRTLEAKAKMLEEGLTEGAANAGVEASVVRAGTILSLHFTAEPPRCLADVQAGPPDVFAAFHRALRDEGVLVPPSPFEAWFPSLAHGDSELALTVDGVRRALHRLS